mgnify:CR=1 FL=1
MTPEQIERRDYSFCVATYKDPLRWERFLVNATNVRKATEDARTYAYKTWGEPADIKAYPRNYIREARRLLAEGRYEGAASPERTRP